MLFRYEHLDLNDLERILEETQSCRRRLVVTDGVFSMDGDIAPLCKLFLPSLSEVATYFQAK